MKIVKTNKAPAAIGPYSAAIKIGNMIFTSGQLPVNPVDGSMPSDIKEQTKQSLENIKGILSEEGYTLSDVVKTTVFITDMAQFADINAVYGEMFGDHKPARSCVQVAKLPKGAGIEIEVIATK
ncbi:MAG: RidA family protein [Clostridia bacterium]|nr:RidA family protein [Clostridia bacterium]